MSNKLWSLLLFSFFLQACGGGSSPPPPPPPPPPPVNNVPVASDESVATNPDNALSGVLAATDADGDPLSFAIADQPVSGTVTLSGNGDEDFVYTPNTAFTGSDSFTFTASDSEDTSPTATIAVEVNSQPVVVGASFSTSEIIAYDGGVSATDVERDAFTFAVSTPPMKGTVSAFDSTTGVFTYTPDVAQDGIDSFGVTASDAFQTSAEATVNVEIFKWAGTQQFGTTERDIATTGGMYRTVDGGFVLGGATDGQIASTIPSGLGDAWLRKVDRRGNEVWTVQYGDASDNNGRIVVADPDGSGTFVIVSGVSPGDTLLYKFDNDGNEQINTPIDFQAVPVFAGAYWGNVDSNGDLYVLSWISGNSSILTKVDGSNGNTLWQRVMEGSDEPVNPTTPFNVDWSVVRLRSVDFDLAGNAIIAGWYFPSAIATARPCSLCGFILTYDTDGNLLATTELDAFASACALPEEGRIYRVTVAPDQTLWTVGYGGPEVPNGAFAQVTRFSADGSQVLWSHCDPTGSENSFNFTPARIASNGDGLVVGYVQAEADPVTMVRESADLVVTRLDVDGNVVFRQAIAGIKADGTPANILSGSITEDPQGLLYLSGLVEGEFVSGAEIGQGDAFLLRLDAAGNLQ